MSIEIDNNIFNIEDEELDEIEYLEILSLNEIIKDNPNFIALSREDIRDNLHELFANKKKAENVTQLFYDILENNNERQGKLSNYNNYIFDVDATKVENILEFDEIKDDAEYFRKLNKLTSAKHEEAKNKYFFSIKYDSKSKYFKYKPSNNINASLVTDDKEFPIYYPVFPLDDVNIPIIASYYKIPTAIVNDYIYNKITSHLINATNINYVESTNIKNINSLIKKVKPSIDDIIEYLRDSFSLDYANINNIFNRFGHSLDFINVEEFDKLCDYMKSVTDYEIERKNVNRAFRIKKADLINKKLTFFEKLASSIKLIKLNEKTIEFLSNLKDSLEEFRVNNIITDDLIDIKTLNIYDIINSINYNDVNPNELLKNIRASLKNININEALKSIENIINTHENLETIIDENEYMKVLFEYNTDHIFDYDNDGKLYLISYRESKEIKEGEDRENYEGGADDDRIDNYMDIEDNDNIANELDENIFVNKPRDYDKYLKNIRYVSEEGFIENLTIVLSIISAVGNLSFIDIDYELLCTEMFKYYRSLPSKYYSYKKAFQDAEIEIDHNSILEFTKIKPKMILEGVVKDKDENVNSILYEVNYNYVKNINMMIIHGFAYWIVNTQERILDNSILIDENYLNNTYIEKWYLYGSPLTNLDKNAKNGILPYLCEIFVDYLKESNEYNIEIDNVNTYIKSIITDYYNDLLTELRTKYNINNEKKKEERGLKEKGNLLKSYKEGNKDRLEKDFLNALIYMPGVNYKKIHKFLIGCCLKKIDESFDTDADLVKAGRKDLIAVKKFYGKNRVTNRPRYLRFIPEIKDKKEEIPNKIKLIKTKDYIYPIKNDKSIVSEWLDKIYDTNPLLPNNILDEIKTNPKNLNKLIEDNITILLKSSRNINKTFYKTFMENKINYRSILLQINVIMHSYKLEFEDENINILVDNAIASVKDILRDIYKLNKIVNDDVVLDVEKIKLYIVSRALCLPFTPESAERGILRSDMEIPKQFVEVNAKKIYKKIFDTIYYGTFPTMEENIDFLNKKREENKQKKLSILNDKTVDENQLISNLKKAGIKNDLMNQEDQDNENNEDNVNNINNLYENEDKHEEKLSAIDEETDDEEMTYNDMGFLYS